MKIKTEKKRLRYTPPPQFAPAKKHTTEDDEELWLVQIPPGVDPKTLAGKKFKMKNNRVVSLNENTEAFVQKKCGGFVVGSEGCIPLSGQLTLRHKIEIPIQSKVLSCLVADTLPEGLKYRAAPR